MEAGRLPNTDRLGSLKQGSRRYPFGDGNESFANDEYATYRRDHASAHYYAWNRYYSATWGRFSSPDPYVMSGGLTNPQGWDRYAYVVGNPVNFYDPAGLQEQAPAIPGYCPAEYTLAECQALGFVRGPDGEGAGGGGVNPCPIGQSWLPNPMCQMLLLPLPPPPPKPAPKEEPECFAQLKYRSVDHPVQYAGAIHAFWWVQDSTGLHHIISAGPVTYSGDATQYLRAWVVDGDSNDKDNSGQKLAWESGLSSAVCDKVAKMLDAANAFPKRGLIYDAVWGPNSNSAAHYFGDVAGFSPSAPPGSYGWGTGIIYPVMPALP
jgi:RHS repeat-associated protein